MKMDVHTRQVIRRMVVAGALAVSALTVAPQASYAAGRTLPLAVVSREYQFIGLPSRLPAATYDLRHFNLGNESHVIVAVNLGPVCSPMITNKVQALAFLQTLEGPEDLAVQCEGSSLAGDVFAPPGGRTSGPVSLAPGRTLYFCPIPESHGVPHDELGMIGLIDVFALPGGFTL